MTTEKRRFVRTTINGTADISSGINIFQDCCIRDVSERGLRIDNIRKSIMTDKSAQCQAVVTINNRIIKVKLVPKWFNPMKNSRLVSGGFEVVNEKDWTNLVPHIHHNDSDDVWGNRGEKYLR